MQMQKQPPEVFYKKGVLRNFIKFTGKHLRQSLFLNKKASELRPAFVFKKMLWHRYFPVNFVKFLRTPFLQNTSERLLPQMEYFFDLLIASSSAATSTSISCTFYLKSIFNLLNPFTYK